MKIFEGYAGMNESVTVSEEYTHLGDNIFTENETIDRKDNL